MRRLTSMPSSVSIPVPSSRSIFALTPVAVITKAASRVTLPSLSADLDLSHRRQPRRSTSTLQEVCTSMPSFLHQLSSNPPAFSSSIRGTMRLPVSTTVEIDATRLTSASRMMQPIKPAPIRTTLEPGLRQPGDNVARVFQRPAGMHLRQIQPGNRRTDGV